MKNRLLILGGIVLLAVSITLAVVLPVEKESEETPPSDTVLVSPLNYVRAETDRNAAIIVSTVSVSRLVSRNSEIIFLALNRKRRKWPKRMGPFGRYW